MSGGSVNTMVTAPFDHLVYVRVFEGCNLHCQHCFIPANPKKMQSEQFSGIPDIVSGFAAQDQRILLQWHGGEPTLLGVDYLVDAIDRVESSTKFQWIHGIQTNLMTYSPEWASVYRKYFGSEVGVSWDWKIRLTSASRPESFDDFEAKFWPNFEKLLSDGLDPYVVITGTKPFFERFKNPVELFDFLHDRGVRRVHIERLTPSGEARLNWGWLGVSNMDWSIYMSRMARAYVAWSKNSGKFLSISPLDGIGASVDRLLAGSAGGYGCLSGVCDTHFHTIDANGYKRGCTAITAEEPDNKRAKVIKIVRIAEERSQRRWNCVSCRYKAICSAGCLASDMDDGSDECAGGFRLFQSMEMLRKAQN